MKQREIYKLMRTWELNVGESFLDYNEDIAKIYQWVFWMTGKGYINLEKFSDLIDKMNNGEDHILTYDDVLRELTGDVSDDKYHILGFATMWLIAGIIELLPTVYGERMKKAFIEHEIEFKIIEYERFDYDEEIKQVEELLKERGIFK